MQAFQYSEQRYTTLCNVIQCYSTLYQKYCAFSLVISPIFSTFVPYNSPPPILPAERSQHYLPTSGPPVSGPNFALKTSLKHLSDFTKTKPRRYSDYLSALIRLILSFTLSNIIHLSRNTQKCKIICIYLLIRIPKYQNTKTLFQITINHPNNIIYILYIIICNIYIIF